MLENILASYKGRQAIWINELPQALSTLGTLIQHELIEIYQEEYSPKENLYQDETLLTVYRSLMPQARWRDEITEIRGIRLQALKLMERLGAPQYDELILYPENQTAMHCGNLTPHRLLRFIFEHQEINELIIFPYPYWSENKVQHYFVLKISDLAKKGAVFYDEKYSSEMAEIIKKSNRLGVIPTWEVQDGKL